MSDTRKKKNIFICIMLVKHSIEHEFIENFFTWLIKFIHQFVAKVWEGGFSPSLLISWYLIHQNPFEFLLNCLLSSNRMKKWFNILFNFFSFLVKVIQPLVFFKNPAYWFRFTYYITSLKFIKIGKKNPKRIEVK